VAALWSPTLALAGSYYLEAEAATTRDDAVTVATALAAAGVEGEVLRLYVRGEGWRYVFRSEEQTNAGVLEAALARVGRPADLGVQLIAVDDGEAVVVRPAQSAAAQERTPASTAAPVAPDRALEAQEILRRVVRAHAGPAPTGGLSSATSVVFRFERQLPGLRVVHVYARRGADIYLQIDVIEGEGVSSQAGIVSGVAWTNVDGAGALDPLFVSNVLRRFAPERVLGMAAVLAAGAPKGREYDEMSVGDSVRIGGRSAVVLDFAGDREAGPRALVIDAGTWRMVEAADGDDLRWRYADYAELGDGSVYPRVAEAWQRDQLVDAIEVLDLDLQPVFPAEWFPTGSR
jgi:hypothetical protein